MRIEQWHWVAQLRQAILQDDAGDTVLVQPLRDGIALAVGDMADVATPRTEHDGRTVRYGCGREEDLEFLGAVLILAIADRCMVRGPKRDPMRGRWLGNRGCGLREEVWRESHQGGKSEDGCSFHDVGC